MKNVRELAVTQTRLFATDTLPFTSLAIVNNSARVRDTFSFKNVGGITEGEGGMLFQLGEYEHDGKQIIVQRLSIEPRRVVLQIGSSSAAAHSFFKALAEVFDDLGWKPTPPKVLTEETQCVAELEFSFDAIYVPAVRGFFDRLPTLLERADSDVFITPQHLRAEALYRIRDEDLIRQHLAIGPKWFVIEPRSQTLLDQRTFFCMSPTDSDTHVAIVEAFEAAMIASTEK